jgi:uncharacterized membrane protein YcaP (DUF421 family)
VDIVFRAIFVFFLIFALTRAIGRRELASLEPFDLILLIVLGDAVQQGLTQDDYSLTGAVLAVGTIGLLQVAVSYSNWRFPRLRQFIDGEPRVVIQDGKPLEKTMKRERLTIDDLREAVRKEQLASIDDVAWGVIETSGEISIIPKRSS